MAEMKGRCTSGESGEEDDEEDEDVGSGAFFPFDLSLCFLQATTPMQTRRTATTAARHPARTSMGRDSSSSPPSW